MLFSSDAGPACDRAVDRFPTAIALVDLGRDLSLLRQTALRFDLRRTPAQLRDFDCVLLRP